MIGHFVHGFTSSLETVLEFSTGSANARRYFLLVLGCCCQLATILITWPLWQRRGSPPNLPIIDLEDLAFGWLLIATLIVVLIRPRYGSVLHVVVLALACISDQFRMQPQFFGLAVLISVCSFDSGPRMGRWVLASTWLWAGIHKLISPEWRGHHAWWLLQQAGLEPTNFYAPFSLIVAFSELAIGLAAFVRTSHAAWMCATLHLGILVFLSPLVAGINFSVIPWNLGLAVIGPWAMLGSSKEPASGVAEHAIRIISVIMPIGFYFGWVDRSLSAVLYSGNVPSGLITHRQNIEHIRGWGEIGVPFPSERRLLREYFQATAQPGDKLHILDPRPLLSDQYFVLTQNHQAVEVKIEEFFDIQPGSVAGIALDDPNAVFHLSRAGARMLKATKESMIYAIDFQSSEFSEKLFAEIQGLPNVQQVQLAGTKIKDDDLRHLKPLRQLTGIGLNDTDITDSGLANLRSLPALQTIQYERTRITNGAVRALIERPEYPEMAPTGTPN